MKNRVDVSTDGINVYAKMIVRPSRIGLYLFGSLILIELMAFIWVFAQAESVEEIIHPIVLVLFVILYFAVKYLFWNLYGVEELIVNTKSISWSYDYGFYKTNLKTVNYNRLGTGYERIRFARGVEIGRLVFFNYRIEDNLPEFMHHTSVLISKEDLRKIEDQIMNVFDNEFNYKNGFIAFSDN